MKVIAFNGSPRSNGNTNQLIEIVLDQLRQEDIQTELIQLGQKPIQGCIACNKCKEIQNQHCIINNDPINKWIDKMMEADGIILGSPTYCCNLTSNLKSLIDRVGYVTKQNGNDMLKHKVGAAIVAVRRCGAAHVFSSINYFFLIHHMIIPGSSYWNQGIGMVPGDVESDEEGIQTMIDLGKNMVWLLQKLNNEQ